MLIPVILSGGAGTRLLPLSRELYPKQLLPLLSDRSLLQETAQRVHGESFAPPLERDRPAMTPSRLSAASSQATAQV